MPDFYSGATNHLGCFIEGFSLRRVQIVCDPHKALFDALRQGQIATYLQKQKIDPSWIPEGEKGQPEALRVLCDDVLARWPQTSESRGEDAELTSPMTDSEVEQWLSNKHKEMGRRPPIRTWEKCPELSQRGVTKPHFEAIWKTQYPNATPGRPRKNKMPQ